MKTLKRVLSILLSALLLISALPLSVFAAPTEEGELLLATVSDIHYYSEALAKYKGEAFYSYLKGSNCVYDNLNGVMDSAFDSLAHEAKEKGLKYLVACGDLTTNGEYEGHVELAERFRKLEADTGIQVFVINGNHDINNPDGADFSYSDMLKHAAKRTSPMDFYNIYYEFGFDQAVSTFSAPDTGKAGALSYALSVDGYRLIMIDAGKYTADNTEKKQNLKETGGNITPEVLDWVRSQVEAAEENGETPLAFTHWNASEMNYLHGEVLQGFVIDNGYKLQETFADMGIHYMFSGHQHVSDIDVTYSDAGEPLYSIITPTITQFPYAYRETAFTKNADGTVSAVFDQIDCDSTKIVESDNGAIYMQPYRNYGFYLQFGNGSPETYLLWLARGLLSNYIEKIQDEGSVVAFLKSQFGFDVEDKINELLNGGFSFGSLDILTASDIMSFVNDLDQQIMNTYIYNPERLWNALESSLRGFVNTRVSDVPCTKFIDSYGFGDSKKPGTIGDLFFSVMAYMYYGNEDISDDAFMQDVLEKAGQPAFVDLIFSAAEEYIVEDLLVDEILAHLYVHLDTLFNGRMQYVTSFLQLVYVFFTGFAKSDVFNASSVNDFISKLVDFGANIDSGSTYKFLLEYLLRKGILHYGSNVKELVYYFIDQYFDQQNKEATAEQIRIILEGCVNDPDPDWDVAYSDRKTAVTPTLEDMQIPGDVTLRLEDNELTVHWITKYSVAGTDIEITEKESGERIPAGLIKTESEADTYTGFGFNFGSFGILPYTRDINTHTATVSGLVPGSTYVYRVGDAQKAFWTEPAEIVIPQSSAERFSFLYLNDYAASTAANAARFAKTFSAAVKNEKNAEFAVLGGSSVLNGKDDTQFSSVINAAGDSFVSMPIWYVPGSADAAESPQMLKHYNIPSPDPYNNDNIGSFYSFDRLNAHFVVLNTNDLEKDGTLSLIQLQWFREDMEASHAKWKIVIVDSAIFGGEPENTALADQMRALSDSLQIDVLLQGGGNAYYRSNMLHDGQFDPAGDTLIKTIGGKVYRSLVLNGTQAVATGTAGTVFAQAKENKELYKAAFTQIAPVYTAITVYENDIVFDVYAVGEDGARAVIESFAVTKQGEKVLFGDIDLNGSVSAADARLALRYAVGLETLQPVQKLTADVDRNQVISAADARAILRSAVGLEKISPVYLEYYKKDLEEIKF